MIKSRLKIIIKVRDVHISDCNHLKIEEVAGPYRSRTVPWPGRTVAGPYRSPPREGEHWINCRQFDVSILDKDIPKSLIKKIYAKYYLDFVLYGFSTDSVQAIVDAGMEGSSEYSKSANEFSNSTFTQHRNAIYKKLQAISKS